MEKMKINGEQAFKRFEIRVALLLGTLVGVVWPFRGWTLLVSLLILISWVTWKENK